MKKKLKILPVVLFSFSLLFAGAPDTLWTRTYGGNSSDIGWSVQQTSDGGFVVVGETRSFGAGEEDVYLIRTDSNGDTLLTRTYGGSENDLGLSVQQNIDGGFIISGWTSSYGGGYASVYLIRTDSICDTLWSKTYGGDSIDAGRLVHQTSDDGFIITGYTRSFGAGEEDIYLIKTDSNGDTLWTKTYGGHSSDNSFSLIQTAEAGFVIAGYTSSFGAGGEDVYLIRTDSNGDTLWTKTYGGTSNDDGWSVQQASDGGFIIVGSTLSLDGVRRDVYIILTNSNGDTLWTKTYGGTRYDAGYSVQQTSDGGFIIVGYTSSFGAGGEDVYLIRTDSNGDSLWTKTFGDTLWDRGHFINITSDGGFIIVGTTNSFGAGQNDIYLIRLDKDTTGIQEEIPYNFLKPNNFIVSYDNGNISIYYTIPYSTSVKLEAYDTQGKLVKVITDEFMHKGSYSVNWDSKRFGSGIYFIKLSANGSAVSKKLITIK